MKNKEGYYTVFNFEAKPELIAELENRNPEIKVVVYRQGSHIPVLEEPIN